VKKTLFITLAILLLAGFLFWVYLQLQKPLPGIKQPDLGRGHVPIGTKVDYNSNPPTSGKHYEEWVKSGIYDAPKDDRNLVHSLEHGYIIISYNCDWKVTSHGLLIIDETLAHGIEESTVSSESSPSARLSNNFRSDECHKLVDQLILVSEKKKLSSNNKLIIVPRPNLDTKIALTAWNFLDKFNDFDEPRIIRFIDAYRDMGPEKTME